jgi:hypothetical protein
LINDFIAALKGKLVNDMPDHIGTGGHVRVKRLNHACHRAALSADDRFLHRWFVAGKKQY